MFSRDDLRHILRWITALIIVVGIIILFIGNHNKQHWPPTIWDWGDFIGGMGTLLALIWAIGGFMFNEMQLRETQKDIQDQLEIFRSAVGSLHHVAASMKLSAADIIAESMPRITPISSLHLEPTSRMTVHARGKKGAINFRNEWYIQSLCIRWKTRWEIGKRRCQHGELSGREAPSSCIWKHRTALQTEGRFMLSSVLTTTLQWVAGSISRWSARANT